MLKQKFKNPMVNNQYKKPACHTDYCFQRRACCNNYRCCVCHCCLGDFQFYSTTFDRCVGNHTDARTDQKSILETNPTRRTTTIEITDKPDIPETKPKTPRQQLTKSLIRQRVTNREVPTRESTTETKQTRRPSVTIKTTSQGRKTTWKKEQQKGSVGYSSAVRDDKTSTIAGVAVALALVAIVAVVILVVCCSRKQKRKRGKAPKAEASANDAAVVTIPLTIENVSDKFREGVEEGTTSDTTIDSTNNPLALANGRKDNYQQSNGSHLGPNHCVNGPKKVGKRQKRSSKHARDGKAEEHRLFNEVSQSCNGSVSTDDRQNQASVLADDHAQRQYLNNRVYTGGQETAVPNGRHHQTLNGSVECDV